MVLCAVTWAPAVLHAGLLGLPSLGSDVLPGSRVCVPADSVPGAPQTVCRRGVDAASVLVLSRLGPVGSSRVHTLVHTASGLVRGLQVWSGRADCVDGFGESRGSPGAGSALSVSVPAGLPPCLLAASRGVGGQARHLLGPGDPAVSRSFGGGWKRDCSRQFSSGRFLRARANVIALCVWTVSLTGSGMCTSVRRTLRPPVL